MSEFKKNGVILLEQPLPVNADAVLKIIEHVVPICADESIHTTTDLERCIEKYDVVNIKLDKTGGFTEALALRQAARLAGMQVVVGCMIATSLSLAPAVLLATDAEFADIDGHLLLSKDREPSLTYKSGAVGPPSTVLWG